eukprot:4756242-Prymnesium_polylepis.1
MHPSLIWQVQGGGVTYHVVDVARCGGDATRAVKGQRAKHRARDFIVRRAAHDAEWPRESRHLSICGRTSVAGMPKELRCAPAKLGWRVPNEGCHLPYGGGTS